ncbi:lipoamide acyltransferase component of branched-chain alpha-keto acid dehydrogenase complex, mitochondrial isoform X2 [Malania oleifera]|uniref:lipoamide acyltransferase component of branched-chain alpha-keto acid dehydrogenase complex, mitochondrial isoform X2 n=1 Tax=Malania oleifera TaxID=397392 RepID=UPI0025AE8DD2|nr:lipoamide acyltransferase component of branched-chain alpha-keto acid dehydrogenase complex, mitochondrial isoform X2 [Malania oleifera]
MADVSIQMCHVPCAVQPVLKTSPIFSATVRSPRSSTGKMIYRRLWQSNTSSSGRRWLCLLASLSSSASPIPSTKFSKHGTLLLGFASQSLSSRYASASFPLANKPITVNMAYSLMRYYFSTQALVDLPAGGIVDVPLAQTGEGIAECELLKWFVHEGDEVDEFQPLCEVQSDKATIEITSRYKGKISQILYAPGDIVKVGETLLKIVVEDSQAPTLTCKGSDNIMSLHSEVYDSTTQSSVPNKHNMGGVLSTPAVRNLAKEYGININDVQGTGKDARVLKEDILNYVAHKETAREPLSSLSVNPAEFLLEREENRCASSADGWQYKDTTVSLRHRTMVKSMTMAAKIPHFHYVEEINCEALIELKASFQRENSDQDVKHTFLPLLIKSLSMALSKYPLMNSCFNDESTEVILRGSHNIGIAMATSYGLVVPNIKKVQSLSILEITKELSRLQQLAVDNKLSPDDISGGTITLSNIGSIGGKFGSPILNVPEVSIIAIGRIQKVPQIADDGSVYAVSIMNVNIGADHRVLDGATVARFCNEWKQLIEKPELLLLHLR